MSCGNGSTPDGTAPSRAAKIGVLPSGMPAPTNRPLPSDPTMTFASTGSRAPRPTLVCAATVAAADELKIASPNQIPPRLLNRVDTLPRPPTEGASFTARPAGCLQAPRGLETRKPLPIRFGLFTVNALTSEEAP